MYKNQVLTTVHQVTVILHVIRKKILIAWSKFDRENLHSAIPPRGERLHQSFRLSRLIDVTEKLPYEHGDTMFPELGCLNGSRCSAGCN
jgi:hypothetical protein